LVPRERASSREIHGEIPRPAVAALWEFAVPSASLIEKCCLIANPVAGNPTHYLIEQAFSHKGLDWRFMTFEVEPDRLGDAMRGLKALGFHGVKVGEPFQKAVIEQLDTLTDAARRCGSVNCITSQGEQFVGDNTEGAAFVELVRQHLDPVGRQAVVIGAGRLGRAIALALADAGMTPVTVVNRNQATGQQLVEHIQQETAAASKFIPLTGEPVGLPPETAVLVNATSLGTASPDAKLPLKIDSLGAKMIVADVAYNTSRTWLTQQAAERGCRIIDGLSLYVQQTALALHAWTGVQPDTVAMREAAEEFLGI
jgi:shikimate dehydrogenase